VKLSDIKKGDKVIVTPMGGGKVSALVTSAGPSWITVGRTRYHRCDGRIEGGRGCARIEPAEQSGTRGEDGNG